MNLLTEVKKMTKTASTNYKNVRVKNGIKRVEKRIKSHAQKGKNHLAVHDVYRDTCDDVYKHFYKEGFTIYLHVREKYMREGYRWKGEEEKKEYEDTRWVWKKWNGKGSYRSFQEKVAGCGEANGYGEKITWNEND